MITLKVALLSSFMLLAITAWGIAIYTADAATGHAAADGYGVVTLAR